MLRQIGQYGSRRIKVSPPIRSFLKQTVVRSRSISRPQQWGRSCRMIFPGFPKPSNKLAEYRAMSSLLPSLIRSFWFISVILVILTKKTVFNWRRGTRLPLAAPVPSRKRLCLPACVGVFVIPREAELVQKPDKHDCPPCYPQCHMACRPETQAIK